jgi:predicted transcriptional regulator of viral defense system
MIDVQSFRDPDRRIGALATEQHGVVARRQLAALGLTPQHIAYRIDIGRLIRIYRGVYAVGHPRLTREGRWMGAVLTCGPRAVVSHADAAAHWELMPARGVLIDVTTPVRSGRQPDRRRIRLHRTGTLTSDEVTVHDAIPVTTAARTLLDLASILRPRELEGAIAQADRLAVSISSRSIVCSTPIRGSTASQRFEGCWTVSQEPTSPRRVARWRSHCFSCAMTTAFRRR